jgi:hypothetical protein
MAISFRPLFPHRRNPDGTINSICSGCFATVATKAAESDLREVEESHVCRGLNHTRILHPPHKPQHKNPS